MFKRPFLTFAVCSNFLHSKCRPKQKLKIAQRVNGIYAVILSRHLSIISIYYAWKNTKKSNGKNKFKISAPSRSYKFELPDESYSVSNIEDYFEYIIKKT